MFFPPACLQSLPSFPRLIPGAARVNTSTASSSLLSACQNLATSGVGGDCYSQRLLGLLEHIQSSSVFWSFPHLLNLQRHFFAAYLQSPANAFRPSPSLWLVGFVAFCRPQQDQPFWHNGCDTAAMLGVPHFLLVTCEGRAVLHIVPLLASAVTLCSWVPGRARHFFFPALRKADLCLLLFWFLTLTACLVFCLSAETGDVLTAVGNPELTMKRARQLAWFLFLLCCGVVKTGYSNWRVENESLLRSTNNLYPRHCQGWCFVDNVGISFLKLDKEAAVSVLLQIRGADLHITVARCEATLTRA